jgi:hypothetical protein
MDASPSFMRQLFSCGQHIKTLTKCALITSALISPDNVRRPLTNPTTSILPQLQTPFNVPLQAVAVNPLQDEFVLAGSNVLSFVNVYEPNRPEVLELPGEAYERIAYIRYNPQADSLLIESCLDRFCTNEQMSLLDLTTKTIQSTYSNVSVYNAFAFTADGSQVVMRSTRGNSPTIFTDIVWDPSTNEATALPDPGANGIVYFEGLNGQNTFLMNGADDTLVWKLESPSKKTAVDIGPGNFTIFGKDENQLLYYDVRLFTTNLPGIIYLKNGQTTTAVEFSDTEVPVATAYCPKIKKFPLASGSYVFDNAHLIYMFDPETNKAEQWFTILNTNRYNFPTFGPDGCKFFVVAGQDPNNVEFSFMDFAQQEGL